MLTMTWTRDAEGHLTALWSDDGVGRRAHAPAPQAPGATRTVGRPRAALTSLWLVLTHLLVKGGMA